MNEPSRETDKGIFSQISSCKICADRFGATETAHAPRPVFRGAGSARLLIAGQAPGARVHASGVPFTDPSGDRLRDWLGLTNDQFYDETRVAILPMAFCFPGYRKGADLPPPPICAKTWRGKALTAFPNLQLTLTIGGYAQKWHIPNAGKVQDTVEAWRDHLPQVLPLPHPSWRNTAWLKKNPWFETELLPVLRTRVAEVMNDPNTN